MKRRILILLLSMLTAAAAQAQMYKWVDANGRVTYSDVPAPASARQSKIRPTAAAEEGEVALPYSLASVGRDHPVVLYTSSPCVPCGEGRNLLASRGIPFSEKTVSTDEDMAQLRQAGGDGRMPYLTVGRVGLTGFEASSWNNALTAAGYPESSRLPANWRQPPAQPAAPKSAAPAPQERN